MHLHAPVADRYRVLFDHLSAGAARCRLIVERDQLADVEVLDSNGAFEPFRGSLSQLFHVFARVREAGRPEALQLRSEGAELSTSVYPVGGDEVMVVIEDVTARERVEQRSREDQDRFQHAFHGNAAAMVIAAVSDMRIIDVNPSWLEMFGATRAEVIGRTVVELGLITESGAHAQVADHAQFADGHERELELRTRAGASFTVLASASPIDIAEGRCTLTTMINITERTRAEASLRELNTELERRVLECTHELETCNRDLDLFSSSVSHDLRAPLRAIHGFTEILLEDFAAVLPQQAKDLLARIHASGGRLRELVEDLLAFSRLGRAALRLTQVELDSLVRAVCDELLAGRELGARLELRMIPLGTCHADPSLLRTVWTNLIDNALKYSRNRERIVIDIGREVRGDEVIYYVRDNGIGFDMTHADRLFGVFQRLHSASEFEGTGIGLANIRQIVERHHGRVGATSELGRGSRFEFTLGTEVT